MHNILLIGPQGSGKGTQAKLVKDLFNIPHISTGDLFREAIASKTELGKVAEQYINDGNLVPDDITFGIIKKRLEKTDCEAGYVLDGFPRTLSQAHALDDITALTHVLEIFISDDVSVDRISKRRLCTKCSLIYGLNRIPKTSNICDKCKGKLVQRDDDKPFAIKKRLETYHDLTEPLLEYYKPRDIVHKIDGVGSVDDVFKRVKKVFE